MVLKDPHCLFAIQLIHFLLIGPSIDPEDIVVESKDVEDPQSFTRVD